MRKELSFIFVLGRERRKSFSSLLFGRNLNRSVIRNRLLLPLLLFLIESSLAKEEGKGRETYSTIILDKFSLSSTRIGVRGNTAGRIARGRRFSCGIDIRCRTFHHNEEKELNDKTFN